MKTKNNRRKYNSKTKTLKGGLSFSFNRLPKTTEETLREFHKKLENIKIKDIEAKFLTNIEKLRQRNAECKSQCLLDGNDEVTRKQMKSMIDSKPFYEWGSVCGNGFNIKQCKESLHTYKKLDTYNKYIQVLSKNIQQHFDILTQEIDPKKNKRSSSLVSPRKMSPSSVSPRKMSPSSGSPRKKSVDSLQSNSSDDSFKSTKSHLSKF